MEKLLGLEDSLNLLHGKRPWHLRAHAVDRDNIPSRQRLYRLRLSGVVQRVVMRTSGWGLILVVAALLVRCVQLSPPNSSFSEAKAIHDVTKGVRSDSTDGPGDTDTARCGAAESARDRSHTASSRLRLRVTRRSHEHLSARAAAPPFKRQVALGKDAVSRDG